ncbi:MAG: UDP-glucose--hexose-1-phosphate uridylyltransferase [Acidobacteriota bacterium]
MSDLNLKEDPHRRFNPLTREWVLVSPHRTKRPWQGQVEKTPTEQVPPYDPDCYLCPGNSRAGGQQNPRYTSTFVFINDFSSLRVDTPRTVWDQKGLLIAQGEPGICRVVCFSPRHDLSLPRMEFQDIRGVVDLWVQQYNDLGGRGDVNYVQIFENRGAMMGASNPHPHCQIWASAHLPNEMAREQASQSEYYQKQQSDLIGDYLALELEAGERVVCENKYFAVLVPFWAAWPFETMIVIKRHVASMDEMTSEEREGLAEILKRLTTRYDNLFEVEFPYSMGFHQRPTDGQPHREWRLHAHFYPPLLRSATVRKFMVGFEMLGMPQRDLTAESAAARLRELSEQHYRDRA